jgi:hypothetical protein
VISATTLALLALVGAPPSPPEAIDTPQKVWADFDPRREPLEIETLRQWSEGGARYHEFYFVLAERPTVLVVKLVENEFSPGSVTYIYTAKLDASPGWQPVTLSAGEFKTERGTPLAGWQSLDYLEFDQTEPASGGPTLADVRWVVP